MRFSKSMLFLSLLMAISLLGCFPFPYINDYEDGREPHEVEKQLQKLQLSAASRSTVIETLGRPLRYRQSHISYEACQDTYGIAIIMGMGYYYTPIAAYESDLQCFELRLEFNDDEKLKYYRKLPRDWKLDEYEEDLSLRELGRQGDAIAQRLWEQSRTFYTSQDSEIIVERKKIEQERQERRSARSINLKRHAEEGDSESQYQLFFLEDRVPVKWLCRAADQNHLNARLELAYLYWSGTYGLPRDYTRSYIWYRLAGSGEHREAVEKWIKKLKKKPSFWSSGQVCNDQQACNIANQIVQLQGMLTPVGVSEAERMLEKWEPGQCERDLKETIPEVDE